MLGLELIQVALGNRKSLSYVPQEKEWEEAYDFAEKQSVVGVCYCGIQRLSEADRANLSMDWLMEWIGQAEYIKSQNERLTEMCERVTKQLRHDGFWCCILKGQGNLVNYQTPSISPCVGGGINLADYRTPGDIDVWAAPMMDEATGKPVEIPIAVQYGKEVDYAYYRGKEAVIEYSLMLARTAGVPRPEVRYNHTALEKVFFSDDREPVEVEIHHRASEMKCPWRNRRLQRWLEEQTYCCGMDVKVGERVFPVPRADFNVVYQLTHIYNHLFDEGIGLRQLVDYYFTLRALHIEQGDLADRTDEIKAWAKSTGLAVHSNEEVMRLIDRLGMRRFAEAVMWVMKEVFGMPDVFLLCEANVVSHSLRQALCELGSGQAGSSAEREGRFLLSEIMQAGNFGKYDKRIDHSGGKTKHAWEKTKHNMRLIRHYPEEVLWEPPFRLYHWCWRKLRLWRWGC